jgi:hypothetical protein
MNKEKVIYIIGFTLALFIVSCNRLDTIEYTPKLTPDHFLAGQHWVKIPIGRDGFVLSQPSSSFFVYFLSFFYIYVGFKFWQDLRNQKSRYYWAIGFFLTGIAAILAGTSYQALGYELKCNGYEFCRWTTWWEINYEILQNVGMNGFLAATAFTHANGKLRKTLLTYAVINTLAYTGLVLYGALTPIPFLVSFEFLELSCLPSILFFLISSTSAYAKKKDRLNLYLRNTWILLIIVMISYVAYMDFGLTSIFWSKGIWFSENDVLHVGLILWVYYVLKKLPSKVTDLTD